jgi:hypothetical protein
MLPIHLKIKDKIKYFIEKKRIPHIIFHGELGVGKRHLMNYLINSIYKTHTEMKDCVMNVNCAHGKGIRFIRDQLKFFAKKNINNKHGNHFKSIILYNAEKLTIDAQSALRRCIELFSHTTRFFIIVEDKNVLLKPILSRFCIIHVPKPIINGTRQTLYNKFRVNDNNTWFKREMANHDNYNNLIKLHNFTTILYNKGFSIFDILSFVEESRHIDDKYKYIVYIKKIKNEFRDEKLIIFISLYYIFLRKEVPLENILNI